MPLVIGSGKLGKPAVSIALSAAERHGAAALPCTGWTGCWTSPGRHAAPDRRHHSPDLGDTPAGATPWSLRSMARAVGHAPSTIHRIWRAFGLQPHRSETFEPSNDPLSVEKVRDIGGLCMSPPEPALVPGVDETARIQPAQQAPTRQGPACSPLSTSPRAR